MIQEYKIENSEYWINIILRLLPYIVLCYYWTLDKSQYHIIVSNRKFQGGLLYDSIPRSWFLLPLFTTRLPSHYQYSIRRGTSGWRSTLAHNSYTYIHHETATREKLRNGVRICEIMSKRWMSVFHFSVECQLA